MAELENHVVIIPCLNEGATIGPLVQLVRGHIREVIVVDDGSGDATNQAAAAAGATVLCHPQNQGKGAALNSGLLAALLRGFAWAVVMDGDGQHRPGDIPAFITKAEASGAALVIGNRMHDRMAIPWLRRRVNQWMSRRISLRVGANLPDTQCGFRLLNLNVWHTLKLQTRHFEIESEMLLAFVESGQRVEFVPIGVVGQTRCSHINPLTDTWRWWRWWRNLSRPRKIPASHSPCLPQRDQHAQAVMTKLSAGMAHRLRTWGIKLFWLVIVGALLGFGYQQAAPKLYRPENKAGFWVGAVHGALMPVALPNLLVGQDVPIFAINHDGRNYKIGYIAGINLCGLIFFGMAFRPTRKLPSPAA